METSMQRFIDAWNLKPHTSPLMPNERRYSFQEMQISSSSNVKFREQSAAVERTMNINHI